MASELDSGQKLKGSEESLARASKALVGLLVEVWWPPMGERLAESEANVMDARGAGIPVRGQ